MRQRFLKGLEFVEDIRGSKKRIAIAMGISDMYLGLIRREKAMKNEEKYISAFTVGCVEITNIIKEQREKLSQWEN